MPEVLGIPGLKKSTRNLPPTLGEKNLSHISSIRSSFVFNKPLF